MSVGPYGEPQLMRAIVERLAEIPVYRGKAMTRRTPDVLIAGHWALEFKRARPSAAMASKPKTGR